ncbi:MAG: histidine kinase, partial [Chitinophagaceae bacterium]|nr:histidine kinase [Chitinophagaceae bacterium]
SFYPQLDNHGIVCSDLAEAPALTGDSLLWILGTNTGKMLYDRRSKSIVHRFEYKPEWQLGTGVELHNSCFYAPNGILWVCSWLGLEKITNYTNQFQKGELPALHTVQYNMLSGIQPHATRPGMLWVGIHGSGVALMNGNTGQIEKSWFRVSPVSDDDLYYGKRWVQSLYRDGKGVIWGGSYDGFVRIAGADVSFVRLADRQNKTLFGEYSLLDSTGWLWMTCWRGLVGYHPASGQRRVAEVVPLPQHQRQFPVLEGLATDAQGYKYVGGQFGLLRFRNGLEDTLRLRYLPGGGVERIIGLAVVQQQLVIGSESGLWLYHLATGQAKHISATWRPVHAHGMKADWLGHVWIYTAEGLVKFTPATNELAVFTTVDGIYAINSDWATLFHYNGEMYLGHRMAFSRWLPNGVGANSSVPQPVITQVLVNGALLPLAPFRQQQWVASPQQQRWEFQFTAFEYQQPDKLRFAWRLLGFDSSWQFTGNRELSFANLKAGKYVLEIMAYNSSGRAAAVPARFSFEIPLPWWARPWARVLQVLLALAAVWALVKWRERRIVQRAAAENLQTRQLAEMQMATLRSQMNPHFIFNSLNSIQKFIWENKQDDASEYLSKFARLIRQILELSGRDLISLKQELDLLKLYVELEHRRCNASFDYQIEVAAGLDADSVQLPPMLLQPFVENAIWHGLSPLKSRAGLLSIKAAYTPAGGLHISIADNGIGRSEAARLKAASSLQRQSVGMQLTERRMQLLGTVLQRDIRYQIDDYFPDQIETGTVITIWL